MAQSKFNEKIYKSRKIILEQLNQRGYDIDDYNEFSISEIYVMFKNKQMDMLLSTKDKNNKTYVKYHLEKTIRPQNIDDFIEDLFVLEQVLTTKDDLIVIINGEPNETMVNHLKFIWETEKIFVLLINIERIQFNVLNHEMVPPHEILDEEDVKKFNERYHITDEDNDKMPSISRFDPPAMAIGIRPGEICKILRPSKTAIVAPFYRLCINK